MPDLVLPVTPKWKPAASFFGRRFPRCCCAGRFPTALGPQRKAWSYPATREQARLVHGAIRRLPPRTVRRSHGAGRRV